jgi:hypothetical protein
MTLPEPTEFHEELLAAYADGELDANSSSLVERWLADHPEARAALRAQRELSSSNSTLWESVEPPKPTRSAWLAVRQEIEAELSPLKLKGDRSRNRYLAGWIIAGLSLSGVAAAVLWLTFISSPQQSQSEQHQPTELVQSNETRFETAPAPHEVSPDPLSTFAVLPIPTDDDVILDRVPDLEEGWLPIGRHPIPGILSLATVEELTLEEISPSAIWPTNSGPKMTIAPGDAPMIFAAKPR